MVCYVSVIFPRGPYHTKMDLIWEHYCYFYTHLYISMVASLGFKDNMVCAPVSGLWNGSAAPIWICRVRGRWDTGKPLLRQGQKQLCGDDHGMPAVLLIAPFPVMDLLCMWTHASGGRPGLLCWVQKAWCHTSSGCSSLCPCSAFVAGLVFFVLVLVYKEQLLWYVLITHPDDAASPAGLGFQQHHFHRGWFGSVQTLWLIILSCHQISRLE